ncbi:MAG: 3-isopropylmalate dehydratase small subunit [Rhodoplanes sp.]|uniref:3-isopropylmalate dehydratase small subunit n=1 Tax=Rhodoplanes sp. TaxID=1968906 RepID=UPI0017D53C28|nr:3-isopropylmalate dehydratase small subunit [Rhodoplanes sp.]NVO15037.1 3-isopropylmalate dehydratase small subunit [Rhodoplanes sp.]
MEPLLRVEGIAAPLLRPNIDTDIIIPSREITSPERTGFADKLFAPWRYLDGARRENPDFVLNRDPFRRAKILIAGENFGCGSSREMAVWALHQFGIRCVIAPSFGAIFRNNCLRNALLPVELPEADVLALASAAEAAPLHLVVDLQACEIRGFDERPLPFAIDADEREGLLSGLDAIDLTLRHRGAIEAFQARDRQDRPWIWRPR